MILYTSSNVLNDIVFENGIFRNLIGGLLSVNHLCFVKFLIMTWSQPYVSISGIRGFGRLSSCTASVQVLFFSCLWRRMPLQIASRSFCCSLFFGSERNVIFALCEDGPHFRASAPQTLAVGLWMRNTFLRIGNHQGFKKMTWSILIYQYSWVATIFQMMQASGLRTNK